MYYTQKSKAGSRQSVCIFELFLVRRTWFSCLQLYVKVWICWLNLYPCKSKSIFLSAFFQKEDQFEITWIHVSGTIHFSVCIINHKVNLIWKWIELVASSDKASLNKKNHLLEDLIIELFLKMWRKKKISYMKSEMFMTHWFIFTCFSSGLFCIKNH